MGGAHVRASSLLLRALLFLLTIDSFHTQFHVNGLDSLAIAVPDSTIVKLRSFRRRIVSILQDSLSVVE